MKRTLKHLVKAASTVAMGLAVSFGAAASETPNLDKINERGTLRVGMSTFVPWAMRDKQGELIGFEIDVAKQLAEIQVGKWNLFLLRGMALFQLCFLKGSM